MTSPSTPRLTFSGHDWENLNRLVALARFEFMHNGDFIDSDDAPIHKAQCAYLAQHFEGPALDWVASQHTMVPAIFTDFDGFVTAVRQGFGVADDNIRSLCMTKLDQLSWDSEVPVFFAELDRLFLALGISGHDTRIAHVTSKLPAVIKAELASQGRSFHNYDTMREFLNTRWALMPKSAAAQKPKSRVKCSNCGKKGHEASVCRKSKN